MSWPARRRGPCACAPRRTSRLCSPAEGAGQRLCSRLRTLPVRSLRCLAGSSLPGSAAWQRRLQPCPCPRPRRSARPRAFMSATSLMRLRSLLVSSLASFLACGISCTRSSIRCRNLQHSARRVQRAAGGTVTRVTPAAARAGRAGRIIRTARRCGCRRCQPLHSTRCAQRNQLVHPPSSRKPAPEGHARVFPAPGEARPPSLAARLQPPHLKVIPLLLSTSTFSLFRHPLVLGSPSAPRAAFGAGCGASSPCSASSCFRLLRLPMLQLRPTSGRARECKNGEGARCA